MVVRGFDIRFGFLIRFPGTFLENWAPLCAGGLSNAGGFIGALCRKSIKIVAMCILFGLILWPSAPAMAGEPDGDPELSLSQAIQTAVDKNPNLEAVRFQVKAAGERIAQAKSTFLPQVQFVENYTHTTNPMWAFGTKLNQGAISQPDFDPSRLNDPDAISNFASTLSVTWPLYDSGQTWYGWQQAKLNREVTDLLLSRTRQQIIARTVTAYLGVLLSDENLKVLEQTLETARIHLKMVSSRFESGFVVKSDLLRARVHIADLEQQRLQARSQAQTARCMLNVAMGEPGNRSYQFTTPLEKGTEAPEDLDAWIQTALSNRPDLKQLEQKLAIAQQEIDKSRAAHLPSFSLMGNYEINTEDFQDDHDNYTVGALVSINLFSGGGLSAKTAEARHALEQVKSMNRALEQQICGETRQAFYTERSSWQRIGVSEAAVDQAVESLRIVRNRYENGLFAIIDLLDAEVVLQQSRTNHLRAVHDHETAVVQLRLAAGVISENDYPN